MIKKFALPAVMALCATLASAQFSWGDGFESYVSGTLCSQPGCGNQANAGGWTGWDNNVGAAGTVVTAFTSSPTVVPHSGNSCLQIGTASDCIQPFSLNYPGTYPTSGFYELSAWTYVPSPLTATTWMIVNNVYNHLGPYQWALQLQFTPAGLVTDVDRGGSTNLIYNQWVQVQVLIDLTNNTMVSLYNGTQVSSGVWNILGGVLAIANIDLYTGGTMFYDDITLQNPPPVFQVNSPAASLDVDGLNGSPYARASVVRTSTFCANANVTVNLGSYNIGSGWDLAITIGPGVPLGSGGFATTHGQIVNVNVFDPTLTFLNGLSFAAPFGSAALPLSLVGPFDITAQMIILDPANLDGFSLSQMTELHVVAGAASVAGPAFDDSAVVVSLNNPSLCNAGSVAFFGTSYSDLGVISNGRVMLGTATPSTSFSPSTAAAMTDYPFVGAWCDLNPVSGGSITISAPSSGVVRVDYLAVPYFGTTIPVTFGIQFDTSNGVVQIDGLGGIVSNVGQQFLGISPGLTGATNPGAQAFAVGGPFTVANVTDMIYALGTEGSLTPSMSMLQFYPSGNGYIWYGF